MSARLILAAVVALIAVTLAAAALGLVNGIAAQPVWLATGALLAFGLFRLPGWLRAVFARLDRTADDGVLALSAGGTAAVAALLGLGGHALAASAVGEAWIAEVWTLSFPALPLAGILAGLGRFAYLETLRWAAADDDG
jgi:hypothetical protein